MHLDPPSHPGFAPKRLARDLHYPRDVTINRSAFGHTLNRFSDAVAQQGRAEVLPALDELQAVRAGGDIAAPSLAPVTQAADMLAPPTHGDEQRCCAPTDVRAKTPTAKREAVRRVLGVDITSRPVSPEVKLMHEALGTYLGLQDGIYRRASSQGGPQ